MKSYLCLLALSLSLSFAIDWSSIQIQNEAEYPQRYVLLAQSVYNQNNNNQNGYLYPLLTYASTAQSGAEGIYGVASAGGQDGTPPINWLAYFNPATNWVANNNQNALQADYSLASALSAMSFVRLEEVDSVGSILRTIYLDSVTMPWGSTAAYQQQDITYAIFTGGYTRYGQPQYWNNKNNNNNNNNNQNQQYYGYGTCSVNLWPFAGHKIGQSSRGTILTPKSLGTMVEILNFPYATRNTHVRLTVAFATVSNIDYSNVTTIGDFDRILVGSEYTSYMYADFSRYAMVDGKESAVKLQYNPWATTTDLYNYKFVNRILLPFTYLGKVIKTQTISATFAAGALNITWDPVIGFGSGPLPYPPGQSSSGLTAGETAGLVIGCLLGSALIGFFVFYCFCVRRAVALKGRGHLQENSLLSADSSHTYKTLV